MQAEDDLRRWLSSHGAPPEWREHPATPTVADAARIKGTLPTGHSKSLLVQEKDKSLTLITTRGLVRADLKAISKAIGARRFSFAAEETMVRTLGVRPGSLSPLALIHDRERQVARVIIDAPLLKEERIWCHPLRNTASVGISPVSMVAFIEAHHGPPVRLDVEAPESFT
ncbi:MAG: prolyl-tRNA synthetase associated domain-containing protein [Pseudomonadota bacterium]